MKKIYNTPQLEVIKIQTQQMLANSITVDVATGDFSACFMFVKRGLRNWGVGGLGRKITGRGPPAIFKFFADYCATQCTE